MDRDNKIYPEYLIAGASKTGTEWLRMCLRKHPEVYIPDGPTIDYFSRHYEKTEDWYLSHFNKANIDDTVVEKSTSYMSCEKSCKRIYEFNPSMEFIFILRDPIERAYSHYCMHMKAGKVKGKVAQELQKGRKYIDEGFYYRHIKRFEKYFGKESINILLFDDLKENPTKFWKSVLSALNVSQDIIPKIVEDKYHTRKTLPKYRKLYRLLVNTNRKMRYKSEIYNAAFIWLNQAGLGNLFHHLIPSNDFPSLSYEDKIHLKKIYKNDYMNLKKYIEKDISSWMNL